MWKNRYAKNGGKKSLWIWKIFLYIYCASNEQKFLCIRLSENKGMRTCLFFSCLKWSENNSDKITIAFEWFGFLLLNGPYQHTKDQKGSQKKIIFIMAVLLRPYPHPLEPPSRNFFNKFKKRPKKSEWHNLYPAPPPRNGTAIKKELICFFAASHKGFWWHFFAHEFFIYFFLAKIQLI